MAEATCRRELELEIPAEEVAKQTEKVAKDLAKVARVPGFRPGKAPISLIKKRFAEDIKGEVLQTLVPERVEKAVAEEKLTPVSQPQVDKLEYNEGQPVKFRASFEVLPEFSLGDYKNLEIELPEMAITDESVANTLAEMQQRAATFVPVEGRTVQNGDFVQVKLLARPKAAASLCKPLAFCATSAPKKPWSHSTNTCSARAPAITRISTSPTPPTIPTPSSPARLFTIPWMSSASKPSSSLS